MSASSTTLGNQEYILQAALSAYSDEMYTSVRRINGTGIVTADGGIDTSTETYIGQKRWYKPTAAVVNTAGTQGTNSDLNGVTSSFESQQADYVKRVATYGHEQINVQEVVSQQDGLAKIARDFSEVRANDEHNAVLNVLRGVAHSEASSPNTRGLETFSDITSTAANNNISALAAQGARDAALGNGVSGSGDTATDVGFFVDLNADNSGVFTGSNNTLVNALSATQQGAVRADALFKSVGMAFQDYEPDFMYLVTSPEVLSELRGANLVDQTTVVEGNIEFQTIFGGKFRLIMTRANQAGSTAYGAGVTANSKVSFLVKPGMISMNMLSVPMPVEIYRDARTYGGGGSTNVFYRWGYVAHPIGYSWAKTSTTSFAEQTEYETGANWARRMDVLNLGILPIFHA